MKFRTELLIPKESFELSYSSKLFFIGSCFSTTMYDQLKNRGFKYLSGNPFGILFNPISIAKALNYTIHLKEFKNEDFFENQGVFRHWDFGSQIFEKDLETTVDQLNKKIKIQYAFLKTANVIFITLGTSWVYELIENKKVVANCHKMKPLLFKKRLLKINEINTELILLIKNIQKINPQVHIVFTVSPIRHTRDGIIENQRSKSILFTIIHEIVECMEKVSYFPSYELVMDDLRDYRYYKKNLLHPNEQAIEYIWGKFKETYFSKSVHEKMKQVEQIKKALGHQSIGNNDNKLLKEKIKIQVQKLQEYIDFEL